MKISDNDIKKAFEKQNIEMPVQSRKEEIVQEAVQHFQRKKLSPEKNRQGFLPVMRLMGKFIHRITSAQGEPVMTMQRFATISIAVFALTLALGTPLVYKHYHPEGMKITETILPDHAARQTEPIEKQKVPQPPDETIFTEDQHEALNLAIQQGKTVPEILESNGATIGDEGNSLHPVPAESPALSGDRVSQKDEKTSAAPLMQSAMRGVYAEQDMPVHEYQDVGRDTFSTITLNQVKLVSENPVSTFSIDVDTASYSFIRRQLNHGLLPQKNAVRIEEMINYFDYDYPLPADKTAPFAPALAVYPSPWNKHTRILHIGIKGYDIQESSKPLSNLVFLLDVSGSMNSSDKLPLLKNSFAMLVNQLAQEDTVAIAVYAGAAGTVLEPTRVKEKGKILAALDRLQAGGSTAGGEGIRLAYALAEANFQKNAVNRVILATDGDFNVGITDREELKSYIERKRQTGIFLSVLGFGQGNYNDALMQTLAQNGNGNAAYIDSLNEARKVLVDEASSTLFTIAKDVKIQIEFNPVMVNDYRLIGYETRLLNREDFNNDAVDAGDVGSGHSVTALYEITPANNPEKLIDDLRYQENTGERSGAGTEYGFLKIRYKLPDEDTSKLITHTISTADEYSQFSQVPAELRFATAVAGFGQLLRNDPYTKDFDFDKVLGIGQESKGIDPFGYRSEFLNLVRLAKTARAM